MRIRLDYSKKGQCPLTACYAIDGAQLSNAEPEKRCQRLREDKSPIYVVTTTPILCGLILAYPSAAYAALSSLLQLIKRYTLIQGKFIPIPNPLNLGMILHVILDGRAMKLTSLCKTTCERTRNAEILMSVLICKSECAVHTHVEVPRHSENRLRNVLVSVRGRENLNVIP